VDGAQAGWSCLGSRKSRPRGRAFDPRLLCLTMGGLLDRTFWKVTPCIRVVPALGYSGVMAPENEPFDVMLPLT
jgi:hypothetical protein